MRSPHSSFLSRALSYYCSFKILLLLSLSSLVSFIAIRASPYLFNKPPPTVRSFPVPTYYQPCIGLNVISTEHPGYLSQEIPSLPPKDHGRVRRRRSQPPKITFLSSNDSRLWRSEAESSTAGTAGLFPRPHACCFPPTGSDCRHHRGSAKPMVKHHDIAYKGRVAQSGSRC